MAGDDLTARLMDDLDPEMLEFIRGRVNSFIKWDLVRLFHDNPHMMDTAENIARYAGRDVNAIADDLAALGQAQVLQVTDVGEMTVYALAPDDTTRRLISRFIRSCEDRQFRVKAIYHVIQGMGGHDDDT